MGTIATQKNNCCCIDRNLTKFINYLPPGNLDVTNCARFVRDLVRGAEWRRTDVNGEARRANLSDEVRFIFRNRGAETRRTVGLVCSDAFASGEMQIRVEAACEHPVRLCVVSEGRRRRHWNC